MKVENVKIFRSGHKTRESCPTLYSVTNRLNKCQYQLHFNCLGYYHLHGIGPMACSGSIVIIGLSSNKNVLQKRLGYDALKL
jgi:hypothetical protein